VSDIKAILSRNVTEVEARIAAACARARRPRADVTLVAVTKYVPAEVARLLFELGVHDLGESRPQELWRKAAVIADARWHLVGHLQRNKVEATLGAACLIHSVDSVRLLQALHREAALRGRQVQALLEFNVSSEAAKHGFDPQSDMAELGEILDQCTAVSVLGLMTMAAVGTTPEQARPTFTALRRLRDHLTGELGLPLPHLSMGMTNDFEVAIEEGATLVRIGSALFQGLETTPHD
jgi:pyridoxal phosphate enzyme (YggS family)